MAALNYVVLVRSAAKWHVETLRPKELEQLYGNQISDVVEAVILLLMADKHCHVEPHHSTHTFLTYTLRAECLLIMLIFASSQLTQPLRAPGVFHPFIDAMMQRGEVEATGLLQALLAHYMDLATEPAAPSRVGPLRLWGASLMPSWSADVTLQPWQFAALNSERSGGGDGVSTLCQRSCWLLLVLLNYRHGQTNPYLAALAQMLDLHVSKRGDDKSCLRPRVSFCGLLDRMAAVLQHSLGGKLSRVRDGARGTVMLLYIILQSNHSFLNSLLAKSEPEEVLAPLLAVLYSYASPSPSSLRAGAFAAADPLASASTYILLVILLILSSDSKYSANLHKADCCLANVEWYKERVLLDVSMGSLTVIVLVRTIQANLRDQDTYIGRTCLAILCNLAPHLAGLHPYAAQRMVFLFEVLSKRAAALSKRLAAGAACHLGAPGASGQGEAGGAATGGGEAAGDEPAMAALQEAEQLADESMEQRGRALDMFRLALTHGPARNPHLTYALIHKRAIFDKYSVEFVQQQRPGRWADGAAAAREQAAFDIILSVADLVGAHVEAALSQQQPATASSASSASSAPWQQRTAAAPSTHAQDWPGEQDKATSLTSTQTRPSPQASRGSSCPPTSASTFSHYNPAFCSVDRVVGLIREAGVKASGRMQLRPAAGVGEEVKYNYVEDEEADLFFTPYLWSQVVVHAQETAKVSWNSQRLLLFDICQ